jgi:hypothetical protein
VNTQTILASTLIKARGDLQDATEHLGRTYYGDEKANQDNMRLAVEATVRAVATLALTLERVTELVVGP